MLFLSVGAQLRRGQINRKAGVQEDPDSIRIKSRVLPLAGNYFGSVLFAIC